jgi:outer membrane receptor protein involved in Fe transport
MSKRTPSIAALLLATALTLPSVAFAQTADPTPQDADTQADDVDDFALQPGTPEEGEVPLEEQPEVSVPGGTIVVTGRRVRDPVRSSSQVLSVLSTEDIARTGEGEIAGALSRVTGLSVVGNGNVFVRGLGDRYSLALLNGLPLPSPQPLSRVVPLDIFPTNVIASSLVQKTYSANFPGEFGGGVINLTTRAVPDESFLRISAGISGDTETTFSNGLSYYGSDFDWFGFDDGTRDVPPALQEFFDSGLRIGDPGVDQQAIVKQLGDPNLILLQEIEDQRPNFSGGLTAGASFDIGASRLGVIATASLSNGLRNRNIIDQNPRTLDLELDRDSLRFVTDNRILANALIGLGLETADHQFRFTNLFIRDTLKQSSLEFSNLVIEDDDAISQGTAWFERQLFDTQFVGELEFDDIAVDVRAGYAQTQRNAPYEYDFTYLRTNNPNEPQGEIFINVLDRQRGSASVTFSELTEDLYYAGFDFSAPVAEWATLTTGLAYQLNDRFSERRDFLIDGDNLPPGVGALRPDLLLGDAIIDFYNIGLAEPSQADPAFAAELDIMAVYGKFLIEPIFGVSVDVGVRYEDSVQTVDTVARFDQPLVSLATTRIASDYFLPGATVTWEVNDDLQLRLHGSKTIARPQFRELIFQPFFDPETQRQYIGNPALDNTELFNAEARAEYYITRGSQFSIAGFYKQLDNPIEPYVSIGSDTTFTTRFANAPSATLFGAEIEAQFDYDLSDLGGWFGTKQAILIANYTYTQSELEVAEGDTTAIFVPGTGDVQSDADLFFDDGDPLTGQSDHIANLQIGFEDLDRLQQLTVLFNYASERVTRRGFGGLPDIVEDPGLRVDIVARQEVRFGGLPLELKFEARNLFGRDNFEFLESEGNRIEINTFEVGQFFGFSVAAEF